MSSTPARAILPQRRSCETFDFRHGPIDYTATVGRYADGQIGEVFLTAGKAGTDLHTATRDTAIAVSFALQHGCPVDRMREAFTRDPEGRPEGAMGALLDMLAEDRKDG